MKQQVSVALRWWGVGQQPCWTEKCGHRSEVRGLMKSAQSLNKKAGQTLLALFAKSEENKSRCFCVCYFGRLMIKVNKVL